jgi:hypothetical protein
MEIIYTFWNEAVVILTLLLNLRESFCRIIWFKEEWKAWNHLNLTLYLRHLESQTDGQKWGGIFTYCSTIIAYWVVWPRWPPSPYPHISNTTNTSSPPLAAFNLLLAKRFVGTSHSQADNSHSVARAGNIYTSQLATWLSGHPHKRYPISAHNCSSITLRMGITDERGTCLDNTSEDSLCSGLAWACDDGSIESPEKGGLSEQWAS